MDVTWPYIPADSRPRLVRPRAAGAMGTDITEALGAGREPVLLPPLTRGHKSFRTSTSLGPRVVVL
jgi:hypothetical protein